MTSSSTPDIPDNDDAPRIARVYILILSVALILRVAAAVLTRKLWNPELFEYDGMARSLLAGRGLVYVHLDVPYHSFAPPFYAWLSAASYWLFHSLVPLMILQIITGSGLAVITAGIAWRLSGRWLAALAAGLLVALHPGLIIYNVTKAHPLTFDAFFFAFAVWQAFRLGERPTIRRAIELGVIVGIGSLSRATLIIFLPLVVVWLLLKASRQSFKYLVRASVVAGICTVLIVIPWTIRTSLLHHRFVFMITTDAEDFWRGNNLNATGGTYIAANETELKALPPDALADLHREPDEIAQADWFSVRSHAFIRDHPSEFVRLTVLKLFRFWWMGAQTGIEYPRWWKIGYTICYLFVLACAAVGLWSLWWTPGAHQNLILVLAFLFALSLLQSLYYVEGRHRWGVEPIVIAISGCGVAGIARRRNQRSVGSF